MTRLVALVSGFGWHVQDLRRAARTARASALDAVPFPERRRAASGIGEPRVEAAGIDLSAVDGVLVRMMPPGSLEQVVFRMDALHRLAAGRPGAEPAPRGRGGGRQVPGAGLLDAAGLPVPPTWVGRVVRRGAWPRSRRWGATSWSSRCSGRRGGGWSASPTPSWRGGPSGPSNGWGRSSTSSGAIRHPGHDLRAFVLGTGSSAPSDATPPTGEWRTNVAVGGPSRGGSRSNAGAERLALARPRAVGARMAGVDLLLDLDGASSCVLEVNAVPGWRALRGATGVDVAAAILADLRDARR